MSGDTGGLIEIERKFDVSPGFVIGDLTGVAGVASVTPPQVHRLSAVYYDTDDLRLAAARITLRRRTGGTDAGWHLKLPAGEGARREIHAPGDGGEDVPAALADRVSGRTGGRPLRPVARLETTRTLRRLTGRDGRALAETADDAVTGSLPAAGATPGGAATGWRVVARWREVEVELVDGPPALLDAVGGHLRAAGAVPSAAASKLARLLSAAGLGPGATQPSAGEAPPAAGRPPGG